MSDFEDLIDEFENEDVLEVLPEVPTTPIFPRAPVGPVFPVVPTHAVSRQDVLRSQRDSYVESYNKILRDSLVVCLKTCGMKKSPVVNANLKKMAKLVADIKAIDSQISGGARRRKTRRQRKRQSQRKTKSRSKRRRIG